MTTINLVHPDDILLFNEVKDAMVRVAKAYQLPLHSVQVTPNASLATAARGTCSTSGDIQLTMRCKNDDGSWTEAMSPEQVWKTAAHELAHLKHFNHGLAFQEFCMELTLAMQNEQVDPTQKIIDKVIKMKKSSASEAALGNAAAAESFAAMVNKLMMDHDLNASDLDYAAMDKDPVIEKRLDFGAYNVKRTKTRIAWQQRLASLVARAHMCQILISSGCNSITFVGTKAHATVAEYVYGTMVPAVDKIADIEYYRYYDQQARLGQASTARGYRKGWLEAFVERIGERFNEQRKASVAASPSESTSLMRINGSLRKVSEYIDNKFSKKRSHYLGELKMGHSHGAGHRDGRAAADRINLGTRGVTSSGPTRRLGSGA